jgi:hypothetical protein
MCMFGICAAPGSTSIATTGLTSAVNVVVKLAILAANEAQKLKVEASNRAVVTVYRLPAVEIFLASWHTGTFNACIQSGKPVKVHGCIHQRTKKHMQ